jgi:hypothetical protein
VPLYTLVMRSVADGLRADTREADSREEPFARLERALMLGDADVQAFATARGLSLDEARRTLALARTIGRVPSVANDIERP